MKTQTKVKARKTLDFIGRWKQYFLRGHNSWFYFIFYFTNFVIIFYKILLEDLYFIPKWVSFWKFALFFLVLYPPIATFVGRFDYQKGTFKGEQEIQLAVNPVWRQNFKRIDELEAQIQELKDILQSFNTGD